MPAVLVCVSWGKCRQWKSHEVEMMEVVADQVAIALCHAAVLEESQVSNACVSCSESLCHLTLSLSEAAVRARDRRELRAGHGASWEARHSFLCVCVYWCVCLPPSGVPVAVGSSGGRRS